MTEQTDNGFVPTDYVALFSGLFEYTSDAVCLLGLEDGILLDVNRSFLHHFELARAEVIGHRASALGVWLLPEDEQAVERELKDHGRIEGYGARMRSRQRTDLAVTVSAILAEWRGQAVILGIAAVVPTG